MKHGDASYMAGSGRRDLRVTPPSFVCTATQNEHGAPRGAPCSSVGSLTSDGADQFGCCGSGARPIPAGHFVWKLLRRTGCDFIVLSEFSLAAIDSTRPSA